MTVFRADAFKKVWRRPAGPGGWVPAAALLVGWREGRALQGAIDMEGDPVIGGGCGQELLADGTRYGGAKRKTRRKAEGWIWPDDCSSAVVYEHDTSP